jgi:hypothetical protein
VPSRIAELVRTSPDWSNDDPGPPDVRAWLDRAYRTLWEIDPVEARVLKVHAQYLQEDSRRHSAKIAKTLSRVAQKMAQRQTPAF